MSAVDVVVWIVVLVGLAGTLLPFVPGTPLIFAGALLHALATGFDPIGGGRLALLALLAALGFAADHVASALGARRYGGSRWAVVGAVAGGIVGLFFGIPGLILGPLLGATLAELLRGRHVSASIRSGLGAVIGVAVGTAASFAIAIVMVGLFGWWTWR